MIGFGSQSFASCVIRSQVIRSFWLRCLSVRRQRSVMWCRNTCNSASGTCFAAPHFPWSQPLAPPAPQRLALQRSAPLSCSPASQLLWRGPTSRARASSAMELSNTHLCDKAPRRMMRLFDLNESRQIAYYSRIEGDASVVCLAQDKRCYSEEEWQALIKPFMED